MSKGNGELYWPQVSTESEEFACDNQDAAIMTYKRKLRQVCDKLEVSTNLPAT